ncbi:MAG TPA: hypothetical protein VJK51_02590 [Candidatus Nanoarchaeia archaeon]|nr:hypothetical protein [Candidatus Nanoarchaeia archaeon]
MNKEDKEEPSKSFLYAPFVLPHLPKIIKKIDEPTWKGIVNVITEKHNRVYRKNKNGGCLNEDPNKNEIKVQVAEFTDRFLDSLVNMNEEQIKYTILEVSRVGTAISAKARSKETDLETIIVKSIKERGSHFNERELSKLHTLLFEMVPQEGRYSFEEEEFNKQVQGIQTLPRQYQEKVIDIAIDLIKKNKDIEEIELMAKKKRVLKSFIEAAKRYVPILSDRFEEWGRKIVTETTSSEDIINRLKDTHGYFNEEVENAAGGLPLSKIQGRLAVYIQALTGKSVKIEKSEGSGKITCSFNGDTFFFPLSIEKGKTEEGNYGIYKALASYQSGAVLYGSYNLTNEAEEKTTDRIRERPTLTDIFKTYKYPHVAASLFESLELKRIDSRLQAEFPGLQEDLAQCKQSIIGEAKEKKEMPLLERIRNHLLVPKKGKKTKDVEEILDKEAEALKDESTTVNNIIEMTRRIYKKLEEKYDLGKETPQEKILDLEIKIESDQRENTALIASPNEAFAIGTRYRYPEWDYKAGRYKDKFVQVVQTNHLTEETGNYVKEVISRDPEGIKRLQHLFESLKPEELKKRKKQVSGEIDFDALVQARAEMKAGITPTEKIFIREYKNQRSVCSLVLAESSGSTAKFVDIRKPSLRIIDYIKHAQIYFSEAMSKIGDPYALATFSGETERNVEFYLIKGFEDPYNEQTKRRIGSLRPMKQNRDGAGIRHATNMLKRQPQKTKLLMYVAEGAPHDFDYEREYAIEDVKKAIIEAKQAGCIPIVIAAGNKKIEMRPIADHCIYREITDPKKLPELLPYLYRKVTL